MMDNLAAICLLAGFFLVGMSAGKSNNQPTQDPCQQIHGLKTIESRDYKPKYNRGLKQVVSTCGEVKK